MRDWIFTPLKRGWKQSEDGRSATDALRAQIDTDVRQFLSDNIERLSAHYALTPQMLELVQALIVADVDNAPVSRRTLAQALQTSVRPGNLVARLGRLERKFGQATPIPGSLPPARLRLIVVNDREDCDEVDGTWVPKPRKPQHFRLAVDHLGPTGWAWGLETLYRRATNLRPKLDGYVERPSLTRRLDAAFAQSRWVCLAGPAGMGKTRAAVEWCTGMHPEYDATATGAWRIDLVGITSVGELVQEVSGVLGVSLGNREDDGVTRIGEALARGPTLLLLDNAEDLGADLKAPVNAWLRAAPGLRVLTTTRTPTRARAERVVAIPPLTDDEARRLFAIRTPGTAVHDPGEQRNLPAILARLSGRAILIELVAHWRDSHDSADLLRRLERLDSRDPMALSGMPDHLAEQITLDETLPWTWDLLSAPAQTLLADLSVFEFDFDVDAAIAVGGLRAAEADARLAELRNHFLITPSTTQGEARLTMLPAIRRFAGRHLARSGRQAGTRRRHAAFFAERARTLSHTFSGAANDAFERFAWQDRVNIRNGIQWAEKREELALLKLCRAQRIGRTGPVDSGVTLLDEVLGFPLPPKLRGVLLLQRAYLHFLRLDWARAEVDGKEAMNIGRQLGDPIIEAQGVRWCSHRFDPTALRRAALLARKAGDAALEASLRTNVAGSTRAEVAAPDRAREWHEIADLHEQIDNIVHVRKRLWCRILAHFTEGDLPAAEALARSGTTELRRAHGYRSTGHSNLAYMHGMVLVVQGRFEEAIPPLQIAADVSDALEMRRMGQAARAVAVGAVLGLGDFERVCTLHDELLAHEPGGRRSIAASISGWTEKIARALLQDGQGVEPMQASEARDADEASAVAAACLDAIAGRVPVAEARATIQALLDLKLFNVSTFAVPVLTRLNALEAARAR